MLLSLQRGFQHVPPHDSAHEKSSQVLAQVSAQVGHAGQVASSQVYRQVL